MRAGAMRETITFTEHTETQKASGAVVKSWTDKYTCRAMLKRTSPVFDKDGVMAKEEYQGVNQYFIIRMTTSVHEKMHVKYNGYLYDIVLIEPIYADKTLLIQTRRANE